MINHADGPRLPSDQTAYVSVPSPQVPFFDFVHRGTVHCSWDLEETDTDKRSLDSAVPVAVKAMGRFGPIEGYELLFEPLQQGRVHFQVRFLTSAAATKAARKYAEPQTLGGVLSNFSVVRVYTTTFVISTELYPRVSMGIVEFYSPFQHRPNRYCRNPRGDDAAMPAFNCLRFWSSEAEDLIDLRRDLESVLSGEAVVDDAGIALWSCSFTEAGEQKRLKNIARKNRTFLYVDVRHRQLHVSGWVDSRNRARRALLDEFPTPSSAKQQSKSVGLPCVVCFTPSDQPLELPRGHVYCRGCRQNRVASATGGPIRCVGNAATCSHYRTHAFLMKDGCLLKDVQQLLERILRTCVRIDADTVRPCPTPDCPSIYYPSKEGIKVDCRACFASVCTTCQGLDP